MNVSGDINPCLTLLPVILEGLQYYLITPRNYYSKLISRIELNNGTVITDQTDILKETQCFYQNLYSAPTVHSDINITEALFTFNFYKLTNEESQALEGEITYLEALNVLKNMKNDKSPGSDGFTAEIFKTFWADLGHFIVRSINYGYINKEMSHV